MPLIFKAPLRAIAKAVQTSHLFNRDQVVTKLLEKMFITLVWKETKRKYRYKPRVLTRAEQIYLSFAVALMLLLFIFTSETLIEWESQSPHRCCTSPSSPCSLSSLSIAVSLYLLWSRSVPPPPVSPPYVLFYLSSPSCMKGFRVLWTWREHLWHR